MTNPEHELKTRSRVFLSYASVDEAAATTLVEGLRSRHLDVWLDEYKLPPGEHWAESIRAAISANAYFLLLLSQNSALSQWENYEIEAVLEELRSRDVTFLPVLLEDCDIPPSLAMYQWFDMRSGVEENLEKLANALRFTPEIDFEKLSPQAFERLVGNLLEELGFVQVQSEQKHGAGRADFIAEFRQKDPFGVETREVYAVETKLYRNSRADLRTLNQLAAYAKSNPKIDKALLVTNGKLTSVALDWAGDAKKITGVPVRVIDGTELKRLLLQHTNLVSKYFSTSRGTA